MLTDLRLDAWITIVTLVALMATLLFTRLRSDVVFLGAVGILFLTGVLDFTQAFSGFINPSLIVVGIMFVIAQDYPTRVCFSGLRNMCLDGRRARLRLCCA